MPRFHLLLQGGNRLPKTRIVIVYRFEGVFSHVGPFEVEFHQTQKGGQGC